MRRKLKNIGLIRINQRKEIFKEEENDIHGGGDTYSTSFFESQPTKIDSAKLEFERGEKGSSKDQPTFFLFIRSFSTKMNVTNIRSAICCPSGKISKEDGRASPMMPKVRGR